MLGCELRGPWVDGQKVNSTFFCEDFVFSQEKATAKFHGCHYLYHFPVTHFLFSKTLWGKTNWSFQLQLYRDSYQSKEKILMSGLVIVPCWSLLFLLPLCQLPTGFVSESSQVHCKMSLLCSYWTCSVLTAIFEVLLESYNFNETFQINRFFSSFAHILFFSMIPPGKQTWFLFVCFCFSFFFPSTWKFPATFVRRFSP